MSGFAAGNHELKQIQSEIEVNGVHTDIVCTEYLDRIFVVITQINKFGTLINATSDLKSDGGRLFEVNTLMGKRDDPLLIIYARQIIERMSMNTAKPLLLAISLKEDGRSTDIFQAVLNHLYSHCTWM